MVSTDVGVTIARTMFKGPGEQVNGLEATPEGLWLCDQRDNRSYLIDFQGQLVTSFPSPARNASGITFGAGSVWVASNTRPAVIFRHDPANAWSKITQQMSYFLDRNAVEVVKQIAQQAAQPTKNIFASVIGIALALFGASGGAFQSGLTLRQR